MHRFVYLIVSLFCVVSGRLAYPKAHSPDTPDTTESYRANERLSRWRTVQRLVMNGALGRDQQREGAMVLVLGQSLEYFTEGKDDRFLELLEAGLGSPEQISRRLIEALEELDTPGDSYAGKRGSFLSAYISTLDRSGQIYSLYVPESYDPGIPCPLEVRPGSNRKFNVPMEVEDGVSHVVAYCQGRGIEGLGELDVLETIRDVQTYYNIDPDRIYLTGGSIGGGAVWRMVARYPDIFAAALVDYGWTWATQRVHLENASNIPMWVYHDTADRRVPVAESRTAVKFLSAMGSPIIYNETSGGGHSGRLKDPTWETREWLLDQRRDPYPTNVVYTTATPLRGRAYWLNILELIEPDALATVTARVAQGLHHNQLFLHLQNVEVLEVELPRKLFLANRPLSVVAGGAPLHVALPLPQQIYVHRKTGDSSDAPYVVSLEDPRSDTPFRQYAAGGLNSLYVFGESLMIVRGTGGQDRTLVDAIERFSDSLSRANRGWSVFGIHECVTGRIPVKADTAITMEDQKGHNLIIVGSAETNRILARITPSLPVVERDGFLHLGNEQYNLAGAGYGLFYYNPLAPKRFVLVMSSPEIEFYTSISNGIADLMDEERPFGLLALRLDPSRVIRRISWNKDWSVPEEAISGEPLPTLFTTDREAVRDLYHRAWCHATGAEFTDYWKPHYYPLWESGARWHDLAAELGQTRTVYVGWASGADLQKVARADSINPEIKLGLYPALDNLCVDPDGEYRYVTGGTWAFFNLLKHPLRNVEPVQVDLFDEIYRLVMRPDLGASPGTNETERE